MRSGPRIYVDMCGDLFHAGHVRLLARAWAMGRELVAGVMNDAEMAAYKHPSILKMAERIAVIEACRWVDRVLPDAPTVPTLAFLDRHGLDIVVHGDDYTPAQVEAYYGEIHRAGRLLLLSYTPGISTSDIIARVRGREPGTLT